MPKSVERLVLYFTAAIAAVGLLLALRQLISHPPQRDFDAYYSAARMANAHLSIYAPPPDSILGSGSLPSPHREYVYPPLLAGLLRPLAALPYRTASIVWLAMNVATVGLLLVLVGQLAQLARQHPILTLSVLLAFPATYITLIEGQVSLLVGALLLYAAVAAGRSAATDRGAEMRAGMALGLASAIKVYPVVLIPIFALHRRWRATLSAVLAGAGATVLGMLLAGGLSDALYWFTHVLRGVVERPWPANQSLAAVLERLAPAPPLQSVWTGAADATVTLHAVLGSPEIAVLLTRVGQAAFLLGAVWTLWRRRSFGSTTALRHDLALGVVLMSLVLPVVWDHYYVQLLLPMALLADDAVTDAFSRRALLASLLLIGVQRFWRQLLLYVASSGLVLACGLLGVVVLYAAVLRLCLRTPRDQQTAAVSALTV